MTNDTLTKDTVTQKTGAVRPSVSVQPGTLQYADKISVKRNSFRFSLISSQSVGGENANVVALLGDFPCDGTIGRTRTDRAARGSGGIWKWRLTRSPPGSGC